ncbi:MAG: hypothetical protein AAFU81_00960 [Pseudomonadota bacterium]
MTLPIKLLFLIVAIAQFFVPVLPQLGIGESIGDRATAYGIPPELPIGVFFSIWSVIFTGLLILAIVNLRAPDAASERLAAPLAFAALGNMVWMVSAQSIGQVWLDFLLLFPIAFFTWEAAYRQDRAGRFDGTWRTILYGLTVGLFAGWLTVAISISVPDLGRWLLGRGVTDAVWQSLWMTLIPAACLAFVFANYVSRNGWYFVALAWGLTGIVINNWTRTGTQALAIAAAIVGLYILFRRIRFGARGSYPAKL